MVVRIVVLVEYEVMDVHAVIEHGGVHGMDTIVLRLESSRNVSYCVRHCGVHHSLFHWFLWKCFYCGYCTFG